MLRYPAAKLQTILRLWLDPSPVGRLIIATALTQWRLVSAGIATSLLLAVLEINTFAVIFLAARVVSNPGMPALPESWGPWAADLAIQLSKLPPGLLFMGLLAAALLLQVAASATRYLNGLCVGYFNARCQARVIPLTHQRILSFSYSCASSMNAGDLIARVSFAPLAVQTQIEQSSVLVSNLLLVVVYLVILAVLSPWLLLTAMALALMLTAVQALLRPRIATASRRLEKRRQELSTRIEQDIQVLRVLHSIGATERAGRVLEQQAAGLEQPFRGLVRLMKISEPVGDLLPVIAATTIAAASWFFFGGPEQMLVAKLATFVLALQRLNIRMAKITLSLNQLFENSGRLALLDQLLDDRNKEFRRRGGEPFQGLRRTIRFEQVELSYRPADRPALTGINLEIPVGTTLALVGPSGAGKSTVIDLLIGLLAPTSGRISVDGIDLQSIELNSWQHRIGIVSQDFQLLNASVEENIGFGRPGVSHAQIEAAAALAGAAGFIAALPDGYASVLGERGHRLSGGQRQRISLARALVSEPNLLILDEATSALDSQSENLILDNLLALPGSPTVVMVAHRLSSITHADHIVVLDGGRIQEEGSHGQLLALGGLYSQLWQKQARRGEPGGRELPGAPERR